MFNKNFLVFWILLVLFFLLVSFLLFIYLRWDAPLPPNGSAVDITLPVIHWDEYLQLSKSLR